MYKHEPYKELKKDVNNKSNEVHKLIIQKKSFESKKTPKMEFFSVKIIYAFRVLIA
jgi:hypothetical protein